MKFKFLALAFLAFGLTGCIEPKPYVIHIPENPNRIDKKLVLPNAITFDGETYTLGHKNQLVAEYHLSGEKDFDWTKLLTISYGNGIYDIDELTTASKNELEKQKSKGANNEYKFEKLSDKKVVSTEIYYPINNQNFNKFEADLKIHEIKSCGAVNVHYAMNFDKDTNIAVVRKAINNKKSYFLKNYPKIECKENITIENSKLKFPQNMKYNGINFAKFKEYPIMYGTKDTNAVTYFSQQNPDKGQIDLIFTPNYVKKDLDSFIAENSEYNKKFDKNREGKFQTISPTKVLQTMLWFPGDKADLKDYEMNFSVIELKSCGMTQTIYKQRFDPKTGSFDQIKAIFDARKADFLKNYPKSSCK